MHVAIVCRGLGGGGSVAAVALRQARELSRWFRVTLVSDSFPAGLTLPSVRVRLPDLRALRRFAHVLDELTFAWAARRALRSAGADFVVCHSHVTALLSVPRGVPSGLFVHGDIRDRPEGTYDSRVTALYRYVTPRAYRKASVVFAPARPFVGIAQRDGARQVVWLPHGIDAAEIGAVEELPRPRSGPRLRVLFVGRLAVEKGLSSLLDACALVGDACELDVVGAGPLGATLRTRATERIRFPGPCPREELAAVYRSHDVLCLPAISETFGLVIAEALLCGVPVIATRVGGIGDLVEDGTNGLLVAPNDPRALAAAIARLAQDEPLRARLAANAPASVRDLDWESIGDRMAEAIRAATDAHRAQAAGRSGS